MLKTIKFILFAHLCVLLLISYETSKPLNVYYNGNIYTIKAAKQLGINNFTGSLEVGNSADFIVLDKNPFEADVEELMSIKVERRYWRGNTNKFN